MDNQGYELVASVDMSYGAGENNPDRKFLSAYQTICDKSIDMMIVVDTWFFASKVSVAPTSNVSTVAALGPEKA
jgi:hypothetical protein